MSEKFADICDKEKFFVLIKNAKTIFVFWNFNEVQKENFENGEYSADIEIKLFAVDEQEPLSVIKLNWEKRKDYLEIPKSGKEYFAVLSAETSSGEKIKFFKSNIVSTPEPQGKEILNTYGSQFFRKGDL